MTYTRDELSKLVQTFSDRILNSTSDLLLFAAYYNFNFSYSGGINGHEKGAFEAFSQIQPSTLKRAAIHLKQKEMIVDNKGKTNGYDLTDKGEEYLRKVIPEYHTERNWDGRVHVITYDLPVQKNSERNSLRAYLKEIHCGMLQQSVWISVYNPSDLVRKYIEEKGLGGELIIVSSVGNEGYIGNMSFKDVAEKVYGLSKLNERYRNYLHMVSEGVTREWNVFVYLSILKDDPQVPFDLQPQDWAGYEAFEKYKQAAGF